MNEKLDAWTGETVDLTARVAASLGTVERELLEELHALRRELAELRATTALLGDEVARLRLGAAAPRRIVPFGPAEGLARLS